MVKRYTLLTVTTCLSVGCVDFSDESTSEHRLTPNGPQQVANSHGLAESYSPLGTLEYLEANNAFFKNLGTSGRTCKSCHAPEGGWTPSASQELWGATGGTDPLFMFTHDTGLCPDSKITKTGDRHKTQALLLERGSTRGGQSIPATAEFEVVSVDDPYNCPGASKKAWFGYREPNPINGESKKTSMTWAPAPQPNMRVALKGVFVGGTRTHGLTTYTPTDAEQNDAADFMLNIYFAQIEDAEAGRLDEDGARGGPVNFANQPWFVGINHTSTGTQSRKVFDIYDAWIDADKNCEGDCAQAERRALIAEGQELFNFRRNKSNGGTCSFCHNSPNVGSRSVYQLFDIGVVDKDDPDLPRVTLRNKTTGAIRIVNNLGRAAATGKWTDIGKMAVPQLRGVGQRAPYFNSGQARSLKDVVEHYEERFKFEFTNHERAALVAFLSAL